MVHRPWGSVPCDWLLFSQRGRFVSLMTKSYSALSNTHLHSAELMSNISHVQHLEVGHIFEVQEGHSIFLKSCNVANCRGFKEHLAHVWSTTPIFYSQLAREREYVRNNLPAYDTWTIPSTPKKHKASLSPDVLSLSPSTASASPASTQAWWSNMVNIHGQQDEKLVHQPWSQLTQLSCKSDANIVDPAEL